MLDATNDQLKEENSTNNSTSQDQSSEEKKIPTKETNVSIEKDPNTNKDVSPAAIDASKEVAEIEEEVAAIAEKESDTKEIKIVDYASMDMEQLIAALEVLLKDEKVQTIKTAVASIKDAFDAQFSVLLAQKKALFLEEGGESIDFHYSSPTKIRCNELIADYKKRKHAYYSDLESQLKSNLNRREAVIEELKSLIEKADSKTMHKEFKELDIVWKSIGPVPRTKYNNTWRNYHHHVERFYDLLHMNNDLRELDFKHNLEEKIKIIAKAEALAVHDDIVYAFKQLQGLHKLWKEDVGPVSREFRDEVWDKFSAATKTIHNRKSAYYEKQKSKYSENEKLKSEVISTLENFETAAYKTHSDWQRGIKDFEAKRELFFKIGKVSANKSQVLWEQLKKATKQFNHAKNKFYKELNSVQQINLESKRKLIEVANTLKDSEDFSETTHQMKRIQAEWKQIGHVPRKYSDKIWHEFKDACNYYFDRVHKIQDNGTPDQIEAFATKTEFMSQLKTVVGNPELSIDEVKAYIKTWKNIGSVPRKERAIDTEFNTLIETIFDSLALPKEDVLLFKYKMTIDGYVATSNTKKLDSELQYLRKKVDEITKEIKLLENNISFISNAKADNPLVVSVTKSIENKTIDLKAWKIKSAYVKKSS
jgi:hypothetical protein